MSTTGGDWVKVLPALFLCLSRTTELDEYARRVVEVVDEFDKHDRGKHLSGARRLGTAAQCRVLEGGNVRPGRTMSPENRSPITTEHFAALPGLRQAARLALIARQPRTVREALSIPDVGRKATRHLLAAGLLTDRERVQTRPP